MTMRSMKKKLLIAGGIVAACWLALAISHRTRPAVVLHYAAEAREPASFFLMEYENTIKELIRPGATMTYRMDRNPGADYYLSVSLPMASGDSVEIKPPFSRVDVYIDADTRIARTVVETGFWARIGAD
ncbi:hypothetical protein E7V67_014680 [[Empedobacter] haloabium]|uniref:Uncharacterized protein n=1 Tax=[Empedobacter] haloabium TaxID=592317 RepID=A0ABZ1UDN5_9BURK